MHEVEKQIMLRQLDSHWKEHIAALDYLRLGILLSGYAQRNLGAVILVVPKETAANGRGRCFIATGRGAEGFLTDEDVAGLRVARLQRHVGLVEQRDRDRGTGALAEAHVQLQQRGHVELLQHERVRGLGRPVPGAPR